ncbi:MAG: hypothetical protein Tsb0021_13780 [Chlamydiales bacterium]
MLRYNLENETFEPFEFSYQQTPKAKILETAIRASRSVIPIFAPVEYNDNWHVDGGFSQFLPDFPLLNGSERAYLYLDVDKLPRDPTEILWKIRQYIPINNSFAKLVCKAFEAQREVFNQSRPNNVFTIKATSLGYNQLFNVPSEDMEKAWIDYTECKTMEVYIKSEIVEFDKQEMQELQAKKEEYEALVIKLEEEGEIKEGVSSATSDS